MLGQLGGLVAAWLGGHPADGVLFALQDGQLSGRRLTRAHAHLKKCRRCRNKAAQMAREWKRVVDSGPAPGFASAIAEKELLARIRGSIRASYPAEEGLPQPQAAAFAQTEAGRQMAAVLGVYLGKRAAGALLNAGESDTPSKQECLAAAGSALTALLGRKGAAAVEARFRWIIDHCPDSAARSSVAVK